VHKELLCEHSPYFQASVKEEWIDPENRIIPLPDDKPYIVNLYVQWIYSDRILSRNPSATEAHGSTELNTLVYAFVFGEKIQDARFKDAVIDAVIKCTLTPGKDGTTWFPGVKAINHAFEGTPPESPLRRLLVDLWARNGRADWDRKGLNSDFTTTLIGELFAHREQRFDPHPTDGKTSTCSYHQHGDDHLCYARRSDT
jgi:hypothetical protein